MSGPLTYDLIRGPIPPELVAFCTAAGKILTCNNVRTDARKAGEYTFEMTVVPKGRRRGEPLTQQSDVVVIAPKPLPIVTEFFAPELLYQEAGAAALLAERESDIPVIDGSGIRLSWRVAQIAELQALRLIGRTADGQVMGEMTYGLELTAEGLALPDELAPFCQLGEAEMVCENVPTEVFQAGTYQFELRPVVGEQLPEETAAPILTELIEIQPQAPEILAFLINGEPAQPKYLVPIQPGVFAPTLTVDWDVSGGETTSVSLQPVPGDVPTVGTIALPLKPESGSTTVTLQARNATGASITQSVVIDTFDPTQPATPEEIAAAAAAAATNASVVAAGEIQAAQQAGAMAGGESSGATGTLPPGVALPESVDTGQVSPSDLPPRFN